MNRGAGSTSLPNQSAIVRLVGALMLEQNDEWAVTRRYMTLETMEEVCNDQFVDSRTARDRLTRHAVVVFSHAAGLPGSTGRFLKSNTSGPSPSRPWGQSTHRRPSSRTHPLASPAGTSAIEGNPLSA